MATLNLCMKLFYIDEVWKLTLNDRQLFQIEEILSYVIAKSYLPDKLAG